MYDRRKGRETREEGFKITRAGIIKVIIFIAVVFVVAYGSVYALGGLETTRQLVIVFALTWLAASFVGYNFFSPERGIAGAAALSVMGVVIVGVLVPVMGEEVTEENVKFFYRGSFTYLGPGENSTLSKDNAIKTVNVDLPYPNTGDNDPYTYPESGFPISIALFDNKGNKEAGWFQNGWQFENVKLRENVNLTLPRENLPDVFVYLGAFNITEVGPKYILQATNLYPGETVVIAEWHYMDAEKADEVTIKNVGNERRSAFITFRPLDEDIRFMITSELHRDYIGNKIEYWTGIVETYSGHWVALAET